MPKQPFRFQSYYRTNSSNGHSFGHGDFTNGGSSSRRARSSSSSGRDGRSLFDGWWPDSWMPWRGRSLEPPLWHFHRVMAGRDEDNEIDQAGWHGTVNV